MIFVCRSLWCGHPSPISTFLIRFEKNAPLPTALNGNECHAVNRETLSVFTIFQSTVESQIFCLHYLLEHSLEPSHKMYTIQIELEGFHEFLSLAHYNFSNLNMERVNKIAVPSEVTPIQTTLQFFTKNITHLRSCQKKNMGTEGRFTIPRCQYRLQNSYPNYHGLAGHLPSVYSELVQEQSSSPRYACE